jgi:hypothetical protein
MKGVIAPECQLYYDYDSRQLRFNIQGLEKMRITREGIVARNSFSEHGDLSIYQGILKINNVDMFSTIYNKTAK